MEEGPNPTPAHPEMPGGVRRGFVLDTALNIVIPVALYRLSRQCFSASEMTALIAAAAFPLAKNAFELLHRRRLDPVAVVVLVGVTVSGVGVLLGGSPRLLLVRDSLCTGAFGLACFISLLLPRPLMFYFGRHFMAGRDPAARARFDAGWQRPHVRYVNRLITVVWGFALLGEFALRLVLVYRLRTTWVLVLSPIVSGAVIVGTFTWTFAYVRRVRRKAES